MYDIPSATPQRLFAGEDVHQAEWRPDGRAIAFTARNDTTQEDIFTMPLDGSARPTPVMRMDRDQYDATWSPDGRSLIYIDDNPLQMFFVLDLAAGKSTKWLETSVLSGSMLGPRISPDGHWLAYWANESGRNEVYVRPFPQNGSVLQISSEGGTEPVWSRTGDELFYREGEKFISARLQKKPDMSVASRQLLFAQPFVTDAGHTFYDVSPDGKTFIFLRNSARQQQVVVVLNWIEDLKRTVLRQ
jgi:serine/threonine-protein kinase